MASWDSVPLPPSPGGASYAAPLVNFSGIGDLGNQYFQGQEQNAKLAQLNAFKGGVPIDPATGQPDIKSMAQTIARLGGTQGALQAVPLIQRQQFLNTYTNQQPPSADEEPQAQSEPQPQRREPVAVAPYGLPVQQATEGMVSAVPDSGPNAGRNIAPEVNAAAPAPTRVAQAAPPEAAPSLLPPGVSEKAAKNLDKTATWYANRANLAESQIGKGAGAGDLKLSEQYAQRAAKMREQISAHDPSTLRFKQREKLQEHELAASDAKMKGITGAASQYQNEGRPYTELAQAILNDPKMYTGFGAQRVLDWNRIKQAFGGDPTSAALIETLSKVTAQQTLNTINLQKDQQMETGSNANRIFTGQINLAMKAAAGMENTITGNRLLTETQRRAGERFVEIQRLAVEYRKNHGGVLDDNWDLKLSKFLNDNPLFDKQERANPVLVGAPQVPDAVAAGGPLRITVWARAMGIGPKDVMRTHDRRYMNGPPSAPAQTQPGSAIAGQSM